MSYLTAKPSKKKPLYLAVFVPILLVGYSATIGSANAAEVARLDKASSLSIVQKLKMGKGYKAVRGSSIDIGRNPESGLKLAATDWMMMDPPLPSPTVTFRDSITGEEVTKAWRQMTSEEILKLLNNTTTQVTIGKFDAAGKVSYLNANATGKAGKYQIIMDYTPYMVEDFIDEANKKIGTAKVGVGYRLTANINTYKANIDLSNLSALGAAANLKKLDGLMRIDTIGITLDNNSGMVLSTKTIDEKSISENLRALTILQSRITDKGTTLDPKVIWIKPLPTENVSEKTSFWDRIRNR